MASFAVAIAAVPLPIVNLCQNEQTIYNALVGEYNINSQDIDERARMRRDMVTKFDELTETCYEAYFDETTDVRITEQDDWIPILRSVQELIRQFDDRQELNENLELWLKAYMAYRKWVRTCGLSRSKLSDYWYSLMEEDSEYGED
jgi:hypothetical protein